MAHHPTKALGIPYVGNKWAHMEMFAAALPSNSLRIHPQYKRFGGDKGYKYLDLTFGCGICSVFMYELGCREFICNDASPYPRLIAKALLANRAKPLTEKQIATRVDTGYRVGWTADNVTTKAIRHRTACTIDAMCEANQDSPLMLVAIAAVLSNGAMSDFRYGTTKHFTPDYIRREVAKKAKRLSYRVGTGCRTAVTDCDYLNIGPSFKNLEGWVCYLDPAWPAQPAQGKKHASNDRVYGFYAQRLMSVLRQVDQPMPKEYSVTLEDCYVGMRLTIELLKEHNTVLIAYQSRPDVVQSVKKAILYDLDFDEYRQQRTSGTKLWEYLWRII